jgi:hypothetical protein
MSLVESFESAPLPCAISSPCGPEVENQYLASEFMKAYFLSFQSRESHFRDFDRLGETDEIQGLKERRFCSLNVKHTAN